jgi:hypothetical protein
MSGAMKRCGKVGSGYGQESVIRLRRVILYPGVDQAGGEPMALGECVVFRGDTGSSSGPAARVGAHGKKQRGHVDVKRLPGLYVAVDFGVDGVMQQRQTVILLMDVGSRLEQIIQCLYIAKLNCLMSGTHSIHRRYTL